MSVTISAVPFLLIATIINVATNVKLERETSASDFLNNFVELKGRDHISYEEFSNIICKEYQTVFLDRGILLKTLSEHGVEQLDILEDEISCKADGYNIRFYRESNQPYKMEVSCAKSLSGDEKVLDIDSEYLKNVQETTYLKIKDNLAKNNLKIDSEEILEDDSILLTVNLE